ncbi:afadin isoform X3 [Ctenocephalides felis]|uniref:afadin isoform X3 n=1 Tax=Ctenocephalides felis TaxID=7515 RepID=UPI000E6E40EA|nr:afadin isoform X3 [Ctenocephalides felis]
MIVDLYNSGCTMNANDKRQLEREALRSVIQQWNANRVDLFELSEPNEDLEFHGVMRFYFQDSGQKVATKCIRVASDATVADVIETLIEKFRPDMRMLSLPSYALYEVHSNHEERRLSPTEKPLLVQLNWHIDDREGRFLLRNVDHKTNAPAVDLAESNNFKRKLSKREKKEFKKKEKLSRLQSDASKENKNAEKLYTELPETSFTRSISNPEAVMRRRRQQKLERKLQQFRSKDGGPDTGGTLKIYGESLCRDVPYKTLLLSIRDCAQAVVREMLTKYGLENADPTHHCLVQVNGDGSEYILDDDECPLAILMSQQNKRGSIMFHVRRRPADAQPRRRKKKPLSGPNGSTSGGLDWSEGPALIEMGPHGQQLEGGRRIRISLEPLEVGSASSAGVQLFGPLIQPKHCLIAIQDNACVVTPLHTDAPTFVNNHRIYQPTVLHHGSVVMFGRVASFKYSDSQQDGRLSRHLAISQSHLDNASVYDRTNNLRTGQELILPAVLEFPEPPQDIFLRHVITELDVNIPTFKLAPVYTLYLCARYRASTHYRPELQPTERANKLTILLHQIANIIQDVIKDRYKDAKSLSFWMANSSEFLHFLKSDRHISAFSVQAQDVLAECVQSAFRYLVSCFHADLSEMLGQFLSENIDHDSAAGLVLSVLGSVMALLRRCRVNAALTIQLFSQLFYYINVKCFNKVVTTPQMCTPFWGQRIQLRLLQLQQWAERQGLELAADCHLAKIVQCTQLLQAHKNIPDDISAINEACFKLNSLQIGALLRQCSDNVAPPLIEIAVRNAESIADELIKGDGREILLEECSELSLALLLPDDGFSCDVVKGVPHGLVDFLQPLQSAGLCRLAVQPTSIGHWTVYMHHYHARSSSALSNKAGQPEIQVIKLHKNSNGMGLSIVAAKGAGQDRLGIYIKSVVAGGAADLDQRLQAGDQLLKVDGQSLIGITQEKAAEFLMHTGAVVTLEVAKQGAIYHGLATLLQQPSPLLNQGPRRMSERDLPSRVSAEGSVKSILPSSKSVPALHHGGSSMQEMSVQSANLKSHSTHNLTQNTTPQQDQGFYQNLSVYRGNSSQPNLDRGSGLRSPQNMVQQNVHQSSRPASAYFPNQSQVPIQTSNQPVSNLRSQSTKDIANFSRENLAQQSLRNTQNYNLTPSMPNITSNVPQMMNNYSGQMLNHSMSNVSQVSNTQSLNHAMPNAAQQYSMRHGSTTLPIASNQLLHHTHSVDQVGQSMSNSQRGLAKMAEMSEEVRRRQYRISNTGPLSPNRTRPLYGVEPQGYQGNILSSPVKQMPNIAPKPQIKQTKGQDEGALSPPIPPTSTHPLYRGNNNQSAGHQQQSNIPQPNMQFAQSHPNINQQQMQQLSLSNQSYNSQQMSGSNVPTHNPLQQQQSEYGNQFSPQFPNPGTGYTASMADPPRVNFYPMNVQGLQSRPGFGANNPWEREEREKELEARREQTRQWRDQQIAELSSLQSRTPQQDEQLRALKLEREFQRRAQEAQNEEEIEQDKETTERVQGILRQAQQNSLINLKADIKLHQPITNSTISSVTPASMVSMKQHEEISGQNTSQIYTPNDEMTITVPNMKESNTPKSILKQNMRIENMNVTSSPSKQNKNTHFSESISSQSLSFDITPNANSTVNSNMSKLTKNFANMSFNKSTDGIDNGSNQYNAAASEHSTQQDYSYYKKEQSIEFPLSPPPPPERNSSFQVMNQQTALRNSINSPLVSSSMDLFNRASDNASQSATNAAQTITSQQSARDRRVSFNENEAASSAVMPSPPQDLDIIREDPDKFIIEAEGMLQGPQTPEATMAITPGVIGAQEVYRDPRQKRLLEQQRQAQINNTPIPEKLSFKEKMKMFALESGENQTPRDKLKISRAQRDIDAVH